jgi:hypothetical protein
MRRLLILAFLAVSGCDTGQAPDNGTSVTIILPPPSDAPIAAPVEPGFTVPIATDIRPG